ncbi:MAG: Brp/Blh family beta-carotene 15,15'-dioxygenase [Cryomorphaceae bacterium]|nr:Brp/Blh family beta-carotene 15,15'-dioxygenase [Flavobacteriales bacterium]
MKYVRSPLFRVQWLLQLFLIALFLSIDVGENLQAIIAGALLCTVGIPHGANDYLYREDTTGLGLVAFTVMYLGVMGVYLLLWWVLPIAALAVFFAISFHHFGQSNFENGAVWHMPSILWGLWILVFPVVIHWEEAFGIFADMTGTAAAADGVIGISGHWAIAVITGGAYLASLFFAVKADRSRYILQFTLVSLWYIATPLLFGFIVVFCLWHAMQSFQHQLDHYKKSTSGSTGAFVKALIPFGIASLAGFGVYVYFRGFEVGEAFILLSLITLPHVVVMHRLYAAGSAESETSL